MVRMDITPFGFWLVRFLPPNRMDITPRCFGLGRKVNFYEKDMRMLTDATVIQNEPCILQHKLFLCSVKLREKVGKVKKMSAS